jgi:hypothetical protein
MSLIGGPKTSLDRPKSHMEASKKGFDEPKSDIGGPNTVLGRPKSHLGRRETRHHLIHTGLVNANGFAPGRAR